GAEPLRREDRKEGAERQAVVEDQKHGRNSEREAEREGEDRDLAVVREQEGREHPEPVLTTVVERRTERCGRSGRIAAVGEPLRDDAVEPGRVRADQQISKQRRAKGERD